MNQAIRGLLPFLLVVGQATAAPPVHLWFEPEWFPGVEGHFAYWPGPAKPMGHWGIAGPGISPEWTQGGESEWNSIGAAAEETAAECHRDFLVPRAGRYKVWVRYVDHRQKSEPFKLQVEQGGKQVAAHEFGVSPVVPAGDEYALYWGFSFAWAGMETELASGHARIILRIDKPGEAWRQVDAVLITNDLGQYKVRPEPYTPVAREKPSFWYEQFFKYSQTPSDSKWRSDSSALHVVAPRTRAPLAGRDFAMWTQIGNEPAWWQQQKPDALPLYE